MSLFSETDIDMAVLPRFCSDMDFLPTLQRELIVSYLTIQQQFDLTNGWDFSTDIEGFKSQEISMEMLLWRATLNTSPSFLHHLCEKAARQGHLQVLQWLRAQRCPWNADTCRSAAENGDFEVLQWLREQECPWNTVGCSWAAMNGHLEVLQCLRAHGCPWDEDTCSSALFMVISRCCSAFA